MWVHSFFYWLTRHSLLVGSHILVQTLRVGRVTDLCEKEEIWCVRRNEMGHITVLVCLLDSSKLPTRSE